MQGFAFLSQSAQDFIEDYDYSEFTWFPDHS